jgi:hypothetical protein
MRKGLLLVLLVLAAGFGTTAAATAAASTVTTSQEFPFNLTVFVPCANGGAGELVTLSGSLHDLFHVTLDGAGGFRVVFLDNPQGVSGTGLTTGAKYQATGVTRDTFGGRVGSVETFVNNFRIIGAGPGNNFMVHENLHVTVNANGTLTAFVDNFSATCS